MHDPQRDDEAFRAIGRYVVTFSELIRLMRELVCEYVAKGETEMHVPSLLLAEATAQVIANAFFGMCRTMGDLAEDEQKVAGLLRRAVGDAIKTRNDIAHGDWWIGSISISGSDVRWLPPQLVRIVPARSEGPEKVLDLSVEDIDLLSHQVEEIRRLVADFGKLALKLPVYEPGEMVRDEDEEVQRVVVTSGKFRVRDVLTVTGGSRGVPARVVRNGPHADAVDCRAGRQLLRTSPKWSAASD